MSDWSDELRKSFPKGTVGLLPKLTCPDCSKKQCQWHQKAKCNECGAYISTAHLHLDYVGHAAVTDRLLSVDPAWTWEPMALDDHGSPALDREGNLWIRLTVCGVTRLGCGDGPSMKERIGDALRNAAMRFGVALDLWTKDELESGHAEDKATPRSSEAGPTRAGAAVEAERRQDQAEPGSTAPPTNTHRRQPPQQAPSDLITPSQAKTRILAACEGDRDAAAKVWGDRGSNPISEGELALLVSGMVDDGRPM